ncbi:hypothetical protein E2C01_021842 [Portunus trituberculatus]|uniref:Uncharacterized protein n=1 Tax=Portunus trituberculatus TaxID=210409 RepID=A0A5B7E620_PORTR|nr:hypothetical protein [Portunus trituberculatus]
MCLCPSGGGRRAPYIALRCSNLLKSLHHILLSKHRLLTAVERSLPLLHCHQLVQDELHVPLIFHHLKHKQKF